MTLNDAQKQQVAGWINAGCKLSEIQKRLETEFGLRLTYLDVRLLVDDLKVMPKDPAPPAAPPTIAAKSPGAPAETAAPGEELSPTNQPRGAAGKVAVAVDTVTRAGALVSGSVTFSDGQQAVWYLDQYGRLGLAPKKQGYRPTATDLEAFQRALQGEMEKLGM
jgi:hypothetical protein